MKFSARPSRVLQKEDPFENLLEKIGELPEEHRQKLYPELDRLRDSLEEKNTQKTVPIRKDSDDYKAHYRSLLNSTGAGFCIIELIFDDAGKPIDYRFLEVNQVFEQHTGLSQAQGKTARELVPQLESHWFEFYGQVALTGKSNHFESGSTEMERWFSVDAFQVGEPEERKVAILFNNITERKQAEILLRDSETRERTRAAEMEALMDTVPVMIWISRDAQCREMFSNRHGYDFLRLADHENVSKTGPKEIVNHQPYEIMKDGRVIPPTKLPMQVAAAKGIPARDYEMDLVFEDGEVHHLLGNVNPLFDDKGKPSGAVGAFVDITTLRRLQQHQIAAMAEMEVQRRLMEQREDERQTIARDLHDGPIQTLSGTAFNLQYIKEMFPGPALEAEIDQISLNIKSAVRELRELLNDLRPPALIRFGLIRAILMHSEDFRERNPQITIELDLEDDVSSLSDPIILALFRIYQESLNNISRHSGATKVRVRWEFDQQTYLLELSDNGRGFDSGGDFSKLISQGHYGLAGMRERAESIGAEFTIESIPSQGTTIRVSGPVL
jgi:PAS domain S-box-containing protein